METHLEDSPALYKVDWDRVRSIVLERKPKQAAIGMTGKSGHLLIYDEGDFVPQFQEAVTEHWYIPTPFRLMMRLGDADETEVTLNCSLPYVETDDEKQDRAAATDKHVQGLIEKLESAQESGNPAEMLGALFGALFGGNTEVKVVSGTELAELQASAEGHRPKGAVLH